jgi:hypothetical protein
MSQASSIFQIAGEAAALLLLDALKGQRTEHQQGAARGSAPAFLRCADQQVDGRATASMPKVPLPGTTATPDY